MAAHTEQAPDETGTATLAWLPLSLALLVLAVMTVLPGMATDVTGNADHAAALLIFAAMSAGFVRGVGFIPRNLIGRALLSTAATLVFFLLACLQLMLNGRLPPIF